MIMNKWADLYYTLPLNNGIFTTFEYSFETNPFWHVSISYLSIEDLKNLEEFNL